MPRSSQFGRLILSIRAESIGASVKLTSSDTAMAKDIVRPKLLMKRPTMPLRKATGMKTASSDKRGGHDREADLARAIDGRIMRRLLLLLEMPEDVLHHDDGVIDHDAHRQRERDEADHVQRDVRDPHDAEGWR